MKASKFKEHFSIVTDPRIERCKNHKLLTVIGISLVGVICGCDSWVEIEDYATEKLEFLSKVFDMTYGVPSHDTIGRLMASIDPAEFNEALVSWTQSLMKKTAGEVLAIDGKAKRGSSDKRKSKRWITTVNVWACANQLTLAQHKVDSKSNEITAIPELLNKLDITGCVITIDAMGTQKHIAEKIRGMSADYLLALKGNHAELHEETVKLFSFLQDHKSVHKEKQWDKGHGRIEKRELWAVPIEKASQWIEDTDTAGWKDLSTLIKIGSERILPDDSLSKHTRYYLTSISIKDLQGRGFINMIRSHWGVENNLHWTLDVCFREDHSQVRSGNADENFSILRKLALNLLKNHPSKASMKRKRMKAGWNNKFLQEVILQL